MRSCGPAALIALALSLAACQAAPLRVPAGSEATLARHAVSGTAEFGDRVVQIAPSALTSLATVTLLNTAGQTVATARTNAAGAFTLSPGPAFAPATGDAFYLDAYKGTRNNLSGGDVARLRTVLQWTASGWTSTSGATVVLNPLTTAVCAIQGLNAGTLAPSVTLNTVSGATVTSGTLAISSNWSMVNTLVRNLLAKDQDPLARISLISGSYRALPNKALPLVLENFRTGSFTDTSLDTEGQVILAGPRPTPIDPASELDYFSPANVAPDTAGTIVTDGTYLYVTNWGEYGSDTTQQKKVKKIGTGFNGTVRGAHYGIFPAALPRTHGAAFYQGSMFTTIVSDANHLFQFDTVTGATATVDVPTPLIHRNTGVAGTGDSFRLIAGDGTYVYNLAYGIGGASLNGFTVQVLDPSQGFRQVRFFTMDTNSYYCDGVLCDGTYLYPINWAGLSGAANSPLVFNAKMRRYRLSDGQPEAEWTFKQNGYAGTYNPVENSAVDGTWDPFNKVFWMGNLTNEKIHLLRGGRYIPSGSWQSATMDTGSAAPLFGRLSWSSEVQGSDGLSLQVRSAATLGELATAAWYGPTSTTDGYTVSGTALNPVHSKHRYLQVRATLSSADLLTTPTLNRLSLEVVP